MTIKSSTMGLVVTLVTCLLVYLAVTLPRWCFRSIARHRMWALRDSLALELRSRVLPSEDDAIRKLMKRCQDTIAVSDQLKFIEFLLVSRKLRAVAAPSVDRLPRFDHLEEADRLRLESLVHGYARLTTYLLFTSSWFGVATLTLVVVNRTIRQRDALRNSMRDLPQDFTDPSVNIATTEINSFGWASGPRLPILA